MNYLESIGHIKEFLQTIKTFFTGKVLGFLFLASSALIFLERFFFLPIIIYPMDKIISWILLLSAIGLGYKLYVFVLDAIMKGIETRKAAQIANELRQQRQQELNDLSDGEKKILNLVLSENNCGVWVAENSAEVLTLLYKGILEKISDKGMFADWEGALNNRAYCIPVVIKQEFRELL